MNLIRNILGMLFNKYRRQPVRDLRDPTRGMLKAGYTTNKISFRKKPKERPNPKF